MLCILMARLSSRTRPPVQCYHCQLSLVHACSCTRVLTSYQLGTLAVLLCTAMSASASSLLPPTLLSTHCCACTCAHFVSPWSRQEGEGDLQGGERGDKQKEEKRQKMNSCLYKATVLVPESLRTITNHQVCNSQEL